MKHEKLYITNTLEELNVVHIDLNAAIERLISLREKYKDQYEELYTDDEVHHGYYKDYVVVVLKGSRQETDEEFQKRVEIQNKELEEQKRKKTEKEYKEYLRLKKKFDKG